MKICHEKRGTILKIIQKVLVKQVITEKSKKQLTKKFQQEIARLKKECEQLQFEQKKMERKYKSYQSTVKKRFAYEINLRQEKIKQLDFKLKQLEILEIGSEIVENEVDALVDIEIGMNWQEQTQPRSIVIKDDIVVHIDK